MENTDEFKDCLEPLIRVSNQINRLQVIHWFNENDIDYFGLNDLEMYIIYIKKNLSNESN